MIEDFIIWDFIWETIHTNETITTFQWREIIKETHKSRVGSIDVRIVRPSILMGISKSIVLKYFVFLERNELQNKCFAKNKILWFPVLYSGHTTTKSRIRTSTQTTHRCQKIPAYHLLLTMAVTLPPRST